MEYITTQQTAEKWGVCLRCVQAYLQQGRIEDAVLFNRVWMIPKDAQKPQDLRHERDSAEKALIYDLGNVVAATTKPMPQHNPDSILDTITQRRLRLQYEGELAYLRGDFERTLSCFRETQGDDAAKLRASSVAIAATISTGDYLQYTEIEDYLKNFIKTNKNEKLSVFAQLMLANAYVSAIAPSMVPKWLQEGDFTALPAGVMPDAAYKRAKFFQCLGQFESMLAIVQTAREFCASRSGFSIHDIYFPVMCALACVALERREQATRYLKRAMSIALPHNFITPFAESLTAFGGLVEQLLEQEYPMHYDAILKQWKRTFPSWITFHNRFTKDNITLTLSLKNYEIALLAAQGVPYAKIAEQFNISVGRLNNKMQEIYKELFISSKKELTKFIL